MYDIENMHEYLRGVSNSIALFDKYRIIDSVVHSVYDYNGSVLKLAPEQHCYDIWKRSGPCANCISKRTCATHGGFFKIEYMDGVIYMIYSVPVTIGEKTYSLELVKDVTDSMLVATHEVADNMEITNIVRSFNEIAVRDTFTGLYNKSYIYNQMQNFVSGDLNGVQTFIGAIFDLDNFKSVNDTYGHYMGDEVIRKTAKVVNNIPVKNNIWAGRLGGDEFFLAFYNFDYEFARNICIQFAELIAEEVFYKDTESFSVEASYGIAEFTAEDTVESFVDNMDKCLYQMKQQKKGISPEKR